MASNWSQVTIQDVANVKSGKRLPKGHSLVSENTGYPYVRLVDVSGGVIRRENVLYLESETQKSIAKYIVEEGDICLAIVGHTIGMVFQVDSSFNKANLTENAVRITGFNDELVPQYLYYFLTSKIGQQEILSRKVGSAQGKLPIYNIRSLPVKLPPLSIQKAIAHILGSLDDKIELNRQQNETLEQMAQALFESWFVHFDPVIDNALAKGNDIPEPFQLRAQNRQALGDKRKPLPDNIQQAFPSSFTYTDELGWVPEGWNWKPFGEYLLKTIGGDWGKELADEKHTIESCIIRGTDIPDLLNGSQSSAPLRWVEEKKTQN